MSTCIHCFKSFSDSTICPHCGYDVGNHYTHPLHLAPLSLLNEQYKLGHVLGQGGFGITYIGFDTRLNRCVAIKEFLPASLASRAKDNSVVPLLGQAPTFAKALHHFIDEARHVARFDHPNIVRVRHYFESNQTAYMVMDYIKGDSPLSLLREHGGCLPLGLALKILFPILDALAIMHAQQVFHLDISAHNILFLEQQQPILIDFGSARHVNVSGEYTQTLTLMLKPGYSPPEQYRLGSEYIGAWTDVYACAALLYLLLTGKLPPPAIERIQDDKRVQNLNLGKQRHEKRVCRAILKGLSLDAELRPSNISAFKTLLLPPKQRYSKTYWGYVSTVILAGSMTWAYLPVPIWFAKPLIFAPQSNYTTPDLPSSTANLPKPTAQTAPMDSISFESPTSAPPIQLSVADSLKQAYFKVKQQDYTAAYQTYQQLLVEDAAQAEAGLLALALLYEQRLSQDPTQAALWTIALQQFPDNQNLRALQQAWQQQQRREAKIKYLAQQAAQQFKAQKLTTPTNDNAHQSYLAILKLKADHEGALLGLQNIAAQYAKWASNKTDFFERDSLIRKGLSVIPNYPALLRLQTKTDFEYVNQQNQHNQKQQAEQMAELLANAQAAQRQKQWNIAQRYYQQILLRDSQYQAAKQGLKRLVAHYLQQAEQQREQKQFIESLLTINKGLAIDAKQPQLLALQHTIQTQLKPAALIEPVDTVDKVAVKTLKPVAVDSKTETKRVMIIPSF